MSEIRVGTCGWSYPSGAGTWNGIFYPPPGDRPRGFDELRYYAEHFDTVEVNVTFYRPPARATVARWVQRTPPGFLFSLKLHQRFTHAVPVQREPVPPSPPADTAVPSFGAAEVDEFLSGIEPIATSGKLGALLAQFPPSFRDSPEAREHLERLLRAFAGYPIAVELRHRSWSDAGDQTLALLAGHGAALAEIDEPKFRFSIRQETMTQAAALAYVRLHGRNATKWWKHDSPDERYDYHYSTAELRPFADRARVVRGLARRAYLYLNNHFAAKAVANAAALRHLLGQPIPGEYRPEMLARYPELTGMVSTSPPGASLFEG